jgi:hypothetical protein
MLEITPLERLVNCTVKGARPVVVFWMKAATGGATAVGGRTAVGMRVLGGTGKLVAKGAKVSVGRLAMAVNTVGGSTGEPVGAPGDVEAVAAIAASVPSNPVVGVVSGAPVRVHAPIPITIRNQTNPMILTLGAFITHLDLYT